MNCTASQAQLSAYLDGELEPKTRAHLADHIAACSVCQHELDELRSIAAQVRASFNELRASAPAAPAAQAEKSKMPFGSRLAAAAAVLILASLTWRSFQAGLAPNHLSQDQTARLTAAGQSALASLAASQEFRIDVDTRPAPRRFHFAKGSGGAYLWQPTTGTNKQVIPFDPSRYLAGSDGDELWVSAPRAQKLPVDATRPPLPRRLALGLDALAKLGPSDNPSDDLTLSTDVDDPSTVWLRASTTTSEGPVTAWIQLDRELATPLAFRIEVEPGESLGIAALEPSEGYQFQLSPTLQPDLTATQEALDVAPLSDALWQLGYTPGAVLPPEALEGLTPEGSGYL